VSVATPSAISSKTRESEVVTYSVSQNYDVILISETFLAIRLIYAC